MKRTGIAQSTQIDDASAEGHDMSVSAERISQRSKTVSNNKSVQRLQPIRIIRVVIEEELSNSAIGEKRSLKRQLLRLISVVLNSIVSDNQRITRIEGPIAKESETFKNFRKHRIVSNVLRVANSVVLLRLQVGV